MLLLFISLALAGDNKWDGRDAHIEATWVVPASVADVQQVLADERALELFPCVHHFDYTDFLAEDADVRACYRLGTFSRRLDATWTRREPELVEIDHQGNKGFVTRFTLTSVDQGTEVHVKTWMNAPPKPFRKFYYTRVRPRWVQCYADGLLALEGAVGHRPLPEPAANEAVSDGTE